MVLDAVNTGYNREILDIVLRRPREVSCRMRHCAHSMCRKAARRRGWSFDSWRRYTCEPAVELAEKLIAMAPGGLGKVLFATGGSDAIEIALAYARAATGRFKTISFWDAFHDAGYENGPWWQRAPHCAGLLGRLSTA